MSGEGSYQERLWDLRLLAAGEARRFQEDRATQTYFANCLAAMTNNYTETNVERIVVSPGWNPLPTTHMLAPATGYTMVVDGDRTPIVSEVFHPDKFGYGCTALLLSREHVESCPTLVSALNDAQFRPGVCGPAREVIERFDQALRKHPSVVSILRDAGTTVGSPTPGGPYCGIYMSRQREHNHVYRVYLVAQGGDIKASNDFYSYLEDRDIQECGAADCGRWTEVFASGKRDAPYDRAEAEALMTRCRLLAAVGDALGIQVGDADAVRQSGRLIDTRSYVVRPTHAVGSRKKLLAYHSNTTPVGGESARRGVLLPESPILGLTLHDTTHTPWEMDESCYGAVPFGTGIDPDGTVHRTRAGKSFEVALRRLGMGHRPGGLELMRMASVRLGELRE